MEYNEIIKMLDTLEIPVAYDHFDTSQDITPPFMAFRELPPDNFKADNLTYVSFFNWEIELVTEKKDFRLEKRIANLLTENKISYEKSEEVWDKDEKIYHIFYEF